MLTRRATAYNRFFLFAGCRGVEIFFDYGLLRFLSHRW